MSEQSVYDVWDLDKEFNREIKKVDIFQHSPDILYHYTTLEGLQGIVQSQKMYLTRIDAVNDATEVQYFHDLLQAY